MMKLAQASLAFVGFTFLVSPVFAWDPVGDLKNPGRIIENAKRETDRAVRDIPNVPRNTQRELGDAIDKVPVFGPRINQIGRDIDRWRLELNAVVGAYALEQWFIASRNSAMNGAMPIPPYIRQQLQGVYDENLLNMVRYKVGDGGALNLANNSIRVGHAEAVTLIDVVVFKGPTEAQDAALWVHELKHVEQFRAWGVRDFSINYLRSWNSVEDVAYAAQRQFATQPRFGGGPITGGPINVGGPMMGNFCSTNMGRFGPGPANPVGTQCHVPTPNGLIFGQVTQ